MLETISAWIEKNPGSSIMIAMLLVNAVASFIVAKVRYRDGFNDGLKAGKESRQTEHRRQRLFDTQENVYGRIKNALMPLSMDKSKRQRGVEVIPLANHLEGDIYRINIFWTNEYHSVGIMSIEIDSQRIKVETLTGPAPQGKARNYETHDLSAIEIMRVISDTIAFITETYESTHLTIRKPSR